MTEQRNWRDAKIPQWIKDDVNAESQALRLTAALAWPKEARPTPAPFQWGGYDNLKGVPSEGVFWGDDGVVHIRKGTREKGSYSDWQFSRDGERWADHKTRGPLFLTERDATLNKLWDACEECAGKLAAIRAKL